MAQDTELFGVQRVTEAFSGQPWIFRRLCQAVAVPPKGPGGASRDKLRKLMEAVGYGWLAKPGEKLLTMNRVDGEI